jgi:hypothetical protein
MLYNKYQLLGIDAHITIVTNLSMVYGITCYGTIASMKKKVFSGIYDLFNTCNTGSYYL